MLLAARQVLREVTMLRIMIDNWLGSYALFSAITMFGLAYRLWQAGTVQRPQHGLVLIVREKI